MAEQIVELGRKLLKRPLRLCGKVSNVALELSRGRACVVRNLTEICQRRLELPLVGWVGNKAFCGPGGVAGFQNELIGVFQYGLSASERAIELIERNIQA